MSHVFISVEREAKLFGRDVTENWTARIELDSDEDIRARVDVRPGPGEGSKPLYKQKEIAPKNIPDEVKGMFESALKTALGDCRQEVLTA